MRSFTDQLAVMYDQNEGTALPMREGVHQICEVFFYRLPQNARILIVGCGPGKLLFQLAQSLPRATFIGIDPEAPLLDYCKQQVIVKGLESRIQLEAVGIEDYSSSEEFDAVAAILVSRHISDDNRAREYFMKLESMLRSGGLLFNVDAHAYAKNDYEFMVVQWCKKAILAGASISAVEKTMERMMNNTKYRSREEIHEYLQTAGFQDIETPLISYHYTAWTAQKKTD